MMIVLLFFSFVSFAQTPVLAPITDTTKPIQHGNANSNVQQKVTPDELPRMQQLLNDIFYPGMKKAAIDNPELIRTNKHMDLIFYLFLLLVLFVGILKSGFPNYFSNMVRVFFNTSLRQNQLTDQLLQSKLPSLLFNIFFVLMTALYLFVLFGKLEFTSIRSTQTLMLFILFIMAMYLVKYFCLQLFGWFSGKAQSADVYIFMVFLVNKFMAIILLPLTMMIYYSEGVVRDFAMVTSILLVLVFFLFRYIRSFVLIGQNLKVGRFHFLLFVVGMEILPILLICKWGMNNIGKTM
jgi:hypothetical protein